MLFIIRQHSSRIFVLVTLLAATGTYGYYCGREWLAKWAFAHQTDFGADELILIAISQTDLTPATNYLLSEGEFAWQGQMVDVLHREIRSDTLLIYGFRDAAETTLKREAAWLYQDTAQPSQPPGTDPNRSRISVFILPTPTGLASVVWLLLPEPKPFFWYAPPHIRLPLLDVLIPPPVR